MTQQTTEPNFGPHEFRRALGNFATGVTIITAVSPEGEKVGVTASSFNSLSMDPPLILWSSIKGKPSCAIFESASHFAVNILASDQMDMSNHFARQQEDKFAGVEWEEGIGGSPLFPNCAGRFQCEAYDKLDGGDHWIFVGKVVAFDDFGRPPLCFHQGSYSMVFGHPGSGPAVDSATPKITSEGRMDDHLFFMMLQAVRAYQTRYSPKLNTLELSLIESRTLLVLNDLPGSDAEALIGHINAPLPEVREALSNLVDRGMVAGEDNKFELTDAGLAKAKDVWKLAEIHEKEAFESFDEEQMNTFKSVLRNIIGN
ncbi:p-hydroxyphenylacetate 3-hydroxylase reductase component [Shimia sp.]|uniref:p-hydroxyphenylacetate 3-hydroxylase reductase component n=1 Tax=Shimia sp. TaxID=1954381 RepID=UPI0032990936